MTSTSEDESSMKQVQFFKLGFSLRYAVLFGGTSALAGWLFTASAMGEDWENFWMYSGSGSFLVAWGLSYFLIQRRHDCSTMRLVTVGTRIALLSHWFCWYLLLLVGYTKGLAGSTSFADPATPLEAVPMAFGYALFSLAFLGWTAVPISIAIAIWLNKRS